MTAQPIRPLLDLPADVQKVSFVMSLGRAINDPAGTFERYAVTPAMVRNFREALGQVKGALDSGRGQPVFLRGASGSGKSHFFDQNYFGELIKLMDEFPEMYADTSALNSPIRSGRMSCRAARSGDMTMTPSLRSTS
jgi:hypothetical protein